MTGMVTSFSFRAKLVSGTFAYYALFSLWFLLQKLTVELHLPIYPTEHLTSEFSLTLDF
jgi:hypothetical protein